MTNAARLKRWVSRPTAQDVAKRALILYVVYRRGEMEEAVKKENAGHDDRTRARTFQWLDAVDLGSAVSPQEERLLTSPVGTLKDQDVLDSLWRLEAIGVLLWAIERLPAIQPYDVPFQGELSGDLPVPAEAETVRAYLKSGRLRSSEQVEDERNIAELWHWRSRTATAQQEPPQGWTFDRIVQASAVQGAKDGILAAPVDGDFPAFGKAYRDLTEDEQSIATSIAMERHYVLNWLSGYARDWDSVPTET